MSKKPSFSYKIELGFEEINLPIFEDILIIGKESPYGKIEISKFFDIFIPDQFIIIEDNHPNVEAIIINKKILKKVSAENIIALLQAKVFPFISSAEILKVELKIKIHYDSFELSI
ncbi:hypothetical protein [Thermophagus xiamenensis]|jgi:hypothetical protein|uniref:Uncharacterized protein n=1 Tax=Thermophagus xiamenensis TaxID=385682 RepID=A0A1I1VY75_9BACT|nr:hypothetical protein [Thermophagus xiamenensis]SFD87854.1 hypothetical protein SAMN05444380_103126 [Thermophagus xiamenensis]